MNIKDLKPGSYEVIGGKGTGIPNSAIGIKTPNYFQRVSQDFKERGQNVIDIAKKDSSLNASAGQFLGGGLQMAGQVAGSVGDIIGEAFAPLLKPVLEKVAQTKIGQKITPIVSDISQKYNTWATENPEASKNLEAVLNLGSLIPIGGGASVAKQGVKGITKTGVESIGKIGTKLGQQTAAVRKVAGDVIPSKGRIVNYEVSRALDLSPGDISNISKATGNEVGTYLAAKNLIRGNKADTVKSLKQFKNTQYNKVREEIGKVKKIYNQTDVPRLKQTLKEIQKKIDEVPGLEEASKEVKQILGKKKISLNDVQRTKELLDEHFSLYKVTGEVAETIAKKGLSNLRKELKEFVEKEVKNTTKTDIQGLNNDVATSRSILDAIETRSPKGLTRSNLRMGDFATFGLATGFTGGNILVGAAAVLLIYCLL